MKYRICPTCGHRNALSNKYCEQCDGESLLGLPIFDSEDIESSTSMESSAEQKSEDANLESAALRPKFVRVCPNCKKRHPYSSKTCDCGELLIAVLPTACDETSDYQIKQESDMKPTFLLRSEDGKSEIRLKDGDEIVLGRNASCAGYLEAKLFVSGEHAQLHVSGSSVTIEHIGRTNPTLVNGTMLARNSPYTLNDGDLIALGAQPEQGVHSYAAYYRFMRLLHSD